MEEIIGDIYDEFEQTKIKINPLQEGGYQINASIDIKTVAELLSLPIENTESTTLAGFIMEKLEKVPKKGDIFSHEDYVFTIEKATPTQVLTVNVNKKIR
jgi:CBS domain containing-hemolysin-like protein